METLGEKIMEKDLVSIVMPCYNGKRFIGESIESVINQTYPKWELLIVDDGSTDDSINVIKHYQTDKRIKLIRQSNSGSAAARNNGIRRSKGQYLALLDSDDIWKPNFLEEQIRFMKEKSAICVYSSYAMINKNSKEILKPVKVKDKITSKDMESLNYIGCLTGLYDQSKHGKIFFKEELNSILDDYAFWLDIVALENVAYGNSKVLAKYRIHEGSTTNNKKKLIKKHYVFYRTYLGQGRLYSLINVVKWGIAGLAKFN